MNHPDHYFLGTIHRTHGVRGDMIISLDTDTPARYKSLKIIYVEVGGALKEYDVKKIAIKEKEKSATIHLAGIEDMTTAEQYLKNDLFLPLSELPKLKGNKFYFHEIINMMVIDSVLGELGPLTNVYELPQQAVGEFTYKNKSVLFPIREEFIEKVDRTEMKFYVTLPEGLVDIYLTDDKKQKQE